MKKASFSLLSILILSLVLFSCGGSKSEFSPESLGLSSDTLEKASDVLETYIDEGKLAGISALLLKDGNVAFRSLHGYADIEDNKKMEAGQLFRIYSMSKPVTAAALMILYDEGLFDLDDPLSEYLPEYANMEVYLFDSDPYAMIEATEPITIRHLLTHTAGFTYGWDPYNYVDSMYRSLDPPLWESTSLKNFSSRVAEIPLKFMPGHVWEYSISIDVAGYLVEVLSGMTFDVFLQTRIFDPLQMNDTGFEVPDSSENRLAMIYQLNYETNENIPQPNLVNGVTKDVTLFSGGGGLVSSIEDYARFGQMLLNGGELDGERILKEETVALIVSDQLPKESKYYDGVGYGLGGSVDLTTGEYHWSGMASTFFWICPENNMVVLCFAQFLPNQKYRFAHKFKEYAERAVVE